MQFFSQNVSKNIVGWYFCKKGRGLTSAIINSLQQLKQDLEFNLLNIKDEFVHIAGGRREVYKKLSISFFSMPKTSRLLQRLLPTQ